MYTQHWHVLFSDHNARADGRILSASRLFDSNKLGDANLAEYIDEGVIDGGMIPKLEESFNALELGLGRIHILLAGTPGGIQKEWTEPGSVGTVLLNSSESATLR